MRGRTDRSIVVVDEVPPVLIVRSRWRDPSARALDVALDDRYRGDRSPMGPWSGRVTERCASMRRRNWGK